MEEFRSLTDKTTCENCSKMTVSDWMSRVEGKRLCKPCGRYTKRHDGKMKPVPVLPTMDCERCGLSVSTTFMLSNRAKVCLDCHNFLFSDYDPTNDPDAPATEDAFDPGEHFFDRCLLIFAYNFLATTTIGRRGLNHAPNAKQAPCKVCHSFMASSWRPALDSTMICEICYTKVNAMIDKYKFGEYLINGEGDAPFEVEGVVTEDFDCAKCNQEIDGTKWRGDEKHGVVLCTPCYSRKHGVALKKRGGTVETEASSAADETAEDGDVDQSAVETREGTVDSRAGVERRSVSMTAREKTEECEDARQAIPSTSSERDSSAMDSIHQSGEGAVDVFVASKTNSAIPRESDVTAQPETLAQNGRTISYDRDTPAPVATMVVDD
jgi:formylmethanofuran dehydrogenase subunit E